MAWTKENEKTLNAVLGLSAEQGRCARLDNLRRDENPHPPASVEHIAWNWGYDGQ